jgi:tetratricopeptide (TPR) repeat protein
MAKKRNPRTAPTKAKWYEVFTWKRLRTALFSKYGIIALICAVAGIGAVCVWINIFVTHNDYSTNINGEISIGQLFLSASVPYAPDLDCANADYEQGQYALSERRFDAALEHFEAALKNQKLLTDGLSVDVGRIHAAIGITNVNIGKYSPAVDSLNQALLIYGGAEGDYRTELGRLHYYSAMAYHGLFDLEKAREETLTAFDIAVSVPFDPEVYDYCFLLFLERGKIEMDSGDYGRALALFDGGLTAKAENDPANKPNNTASSIKIPCQEIYDEPTSVTYYAQDTELAALLCNRALTYIVYGEWDKAERDTDIAISILKKSPVVQQDILPLCYDNLSMIAIHSEDFDTSLQYISEAIKHLEHRGRAAHPETALMYEHQGVVLTILHRFKEAVNSHRKAADIFQAAGLPTEAARERDKAALISELHLQN